MGSGKSAGGRLGRWLAAAASITRGRFRRVIPFLALLGVVGWGTRAAWQRWGLPVTQGDRYRVTAEEMLVTPQPKWIHTDVKSDVIRDSQLGELQLLDPHLTEKISRAFALHSWVARVVKVRKEYPAKIAVELQYRRPVAMVEVASTTGPGLFFVDEQGVLLPSDDFALRQTQDYLRIQASHATPAGVYGTPWGDIRIERAAVLAKVLADHWQNLGLRRLRVADRPGSDTIFELEAKDGQIVRWGHAPGSEVPAERSADEKIRFLLAAPKEKLPASIDGLP